MKNARKAMQDGMASMHGMMGTESAMGPRRGGNQNDGRRWPDRWKGLADELTDRPYWLRTM